MAIYSLSLSKNANEGEKATFTVSRDVTTSSGRVLFWTENNSQNSNLTASEFDFDETRGYVDFEPGKKYFTVGVSTKLDSTEEEAETFSANIRAVNDWDTMEPGKSQVIASIGNVVPYSLFNISTLKNTSEGEDIIFRITRSGNTSKYASVRFTTIDGTASDGAGQIGDYVRNATTVYFKPGETYKDINVKTNKDNILEDTETVLGRLTAPTSTGDKLGTITETKAEISNTFQARTTYSFLPFDTSVSEGEPATFRILRSGDTTGDGLVYFSTIDITAKASTGDYQQRTKIPVHFKSGQSYGHVSVITNQDQVTEADENFRGWLINAQETSAVENYTNSERTIKNGGTTSDKVTYTLHIPTKAEGGSGDTVAEGGQAIFRIFRSGSNTNLSKSSNVKFATSSQTAKAQKDYSGRNRTITFNPGETTKDVAVDIYTDQLNESKEFFLGKLTALNKSQDIIIGSPQKAFITNGGTSPNKYNYTLKIPSRTDGGTGNTAQEGSLIKFRVYRDSSDANMRKSSRINFATSSQTAKAKKDYKGINRSITFNPGETYKDILVQTYKDNIKESQEYFYGKLYSKDKTVDAIFESPQKAYIADGDESTNKYAYTLKILSVDEGGSGIASAEGGQIVFRILRNSNNGLSESSSVQFMTSGITAKAKSDYSGKNRKVTFDAGDSYKDVIVGIYNDDIQEPQEYFFGKIKALNGRDDTILGSPQRAYINNRGGFDNNTPENKYSLSILNNGQHGSSKNGYDQWNGTPVRLKACRSQFSEKSHEKVWIESYNGTAWEAKSFLNRSKDWGESWVNWDAGQECATIEMPTSRSNKTDQTYFTAGLVTIDTDPKSPTHGMELGLSSRIKVYIDPYTDPTVGIVLPGTGEII